MYSDILGLPLPNNKLITNRFVLVRNILKPKTFADVV